MKNVKLVEPRLRGTWAYFDQVRVALAVLESSVNTSKPWKMGFFIDGGAYPLKEISHFRSWVAGLHVNASYFGVYKPICHFNDTGQGKCWRTPARCLDKGCTKMSHAPFGAVVVPSVNWVMLPYSLAMYINSTSIKKPFSDFFSWTVYPDENFWSTIFWSSPWKNYSIHENWLFTRWNVPCLTYRNHRSHNSPCYLGLSDLDEVQYSNIY